MKHPSKWRDTIDVFELPFKKIEILEVLGYPPAGNDVFFASVLFENQKHFAYIKVERQTGADIKNEVEILKNSLPYSPQILEYSLDEPKFLVTMEGLGEKLSTIVLENSATNVDEFLFKQAAALSIFHNLTFLCKQVKDRKFFHIPDQEYCKKHQLEFAREFLLKNSPKNSTSCFVHGDFHYGNILWQAGEISTVLDFELAGMGTREFDLAWSIFLRPSQAFGKTWQSVESFLKGYQNPYDFSAFCFYYVQIATYFFPLGDDEYKTNIKKLAKIAIAKLVSPNKIGNTKMNSVQK